MTNSHLIIEIMVNTSRNRSLFWKKKWGQKNLRGQIWGQANFWGQANWIILPIRWSYTDALQCQMLESSHVALGLRYILLTVLFKTDSIGYRPSATVLTEDCLIQDGQEFSSRTTVCSASEVDLLWLASSVRSASPWQAY